MFLVDELIGSGSNGFHPTADLSCPFSYLFKTSSRQNNIRIYDESDMMSLLWTPCSVFSHTSEVSFQQGLLMIVDHVRYADKFIRCLIFRERFSCHNICFGELALSWHSTLEQGESGQFQQATTSTE